MTVVGKKNWLLRVFNIMGGHVRKIGGRQWEISHNTTSPYVEKTESKTPQISYG